MHTYIYRLLNSSFWGKHQARDNYWLAPEEQAHKNIWQQLSTLAGKKKVNSVVLCINCKIPQTPGVPGEIIMPLEKSAFQILKKFFIRRIRTLNFVFQSKTTQRENFLYKSQFSNSFNLTQTQFSLPVLSHNQTKHKRLTRLSTIINTMGMTSLGFSLMLKSYWLYPISHSSFYSTPPNPSAFNKSYIKCNLPFLITAPLHGKLNIVSESV